MINIKDMNLKELGAYICEELSKDDIEVVLSGGSCVEIYSKGDYTSYDLDLVNRYNETFKKIDKIMKSLGFEEKGKYFIHKDTSYFIEFPSGPLGVGDSNVQAIATIQTKYGDLKLLTATDCIKDRLAAYYHWKDEQSLQQAVWVAQGNEIDFDELKNWSKKENSLHKYQVFLDSLNN